VALLDKLRRAHKEPVRPNYPAGKRLYCIGDIHGRADLLERLHQAIVDDASGFAGQLQALYLGDYIDRGEESSRVIELLLQQPLEGFECIHLLGNHEQSMLGFLTDPVAMASWLSFGGMATLFSYGVGLGRIPGTGDLELLRGKLEENLPHRHRRFLEDCALYHREGSYYFVHAGVRPGVALERQRVEDQLWIREEFIESRANHGAIVVHGHTVTAQAELCPNRINIDTGAYRTGVLTALVLEGETQRLIQTGAGAPE
jgi:serine/threonine protein phosphatase 1